jgi:multidrug resistance efflux pump
MNRWFKAELDHWRAQRSQAIATLELYFNDSVGIGEHSEISTEIHKWTSKLSEAEENLENLRIYFEVDGTAKQVKQLLKD